MKFKYIRIDRGTGERKEIRESEAHGKIGQLTGDEVVFLENLIRSDDQIAYIKGSFCDYEIQKVP